MIGQLQQQSTQRMGWEANIDSTHSPTDSKVSPSRASTVLAAPLHLPGMIWDEGTNRSMITHSQSTTLIKSPILALTGKSASVNRVIRTHIHLGLGRTWHKVRKRTRCALSWVNFPNDRLLLGAASWVSLQR